MPKCKKHLLLFVSDTESWKSQESRLFITGVGFRYRELECRNTLQQECRNDETMKCVFGHRWWSHRRRAVEKSSKIQAPFWSLGHGESRRLITESPKCEMRNTCSELTLGHNPWSHRRRLKGGGSMKLISI
jgi:hypothetical protein